MSLQYKKRLGIYKNYNGSNMFNPDTFQAYSYDWWCYLKSFGGLKVFNTYSYSNTTCKHQSQMRKLLCDLGENLDTYWKIECPEGLHTENGLKSGIQLYSRRIADLESAIAKPRTHKAKNEERRALINQYKIKIEMIEKLLKAYYGGE